MPASARREVTGVTPSWFGPAPPSSGAHTPGTVEPLGPRRIGAKRVVGIVVGVGGRSDERPAGVWENSAG